MCIVLETFVWLFSPVVGPCLVEWFYYEPQASSVKASESIPMLTSERPSDFPIMFATPLACYDITLHMLNISSGRGLGKDGRSVRYNQTDIYAWSLPPRIDHWSRSLRGHSPFCLGTEILKPVLNTKLHDESRTYVVVVSVHPCRDPTVEIFIH
jgi:hypothetical protein